MARRTKVASLTKRLKSRPLAYVDKKGNVRHFARGKKSSLLQRNVVSKDLIKKRKAKGKKGILLFVKGKGVFSVPRKSGGKKRRKGKKARRKSRVRRLRSRRRGRTKARRRKSRRCPKTRSSRSHRAAKSCIRAGKGRSLAKRKVFNKAVRRLRKTKAGRAWLKKNRVKMAKGVRKARKARRKSRKARKARRKSRKSRRRRR